MANTVDHFARVGAPSRSYPLDRSAELPDATGAPGLRRVLGVLRRRAWLITVMALAGAAAAAAVLHVERRFYNAIAVVRLADERNVLAAGLKGAATPQATAAFGADPIESEVAVIRGRGVAGAVVDRLGLRVFDRKQAAPSGMVRDVMLDSTVQRLGGVRLTFAPSHYELGTPRGTTRAAYGRPAGVSGLRLTVPVRPATDAADLVVVTRDDAIDYVTGQVRVGAQEGTALIGVRFMAPYAPLAVNVVNAIVTEYRDQNEATARAEAAKRREFLGAQLVEAEARLAATQSALAAFRTRVGVYSSQSVLSADQSGAMQLETRREELLADLRLFESLQGQLRAPDATRRIAVRRLATAQQIAENPTVSQLFAQLSQYEQRRDTLDAAGMLPAHPQVQHVDGLIHATLPRLEEAIGTQLASLRSRLTSIEELRARVSGKLQALSPAEAEESTLKQRVAAAQMFSDQVRQEYQNARLGESVADGHVSILETAGRATVVPVRRPLKLALGLACGLLLGVALALTLDNLNTGLVRRADMERALQVRGLAVIPKIDGTPGRRTAPSGALVGPRRDRGGVKLPRNRVPTSAEVLPAGGLYAVTPTDGMDGMGADAFRALRTQLMYSREIGGMQTLVVTSALAQEGKTTTAASLAASFAMQGQRVLLIDCDLRRPSVHRALGIATAPGLTDVLCARTTVGGAIQTTGMEHLFALTCGHRVPHAPELLSGPGMTALLGELAGDFDLVVIDTPPLLLAPDATGLAARADGVLLVVRAGATGRAAAQDALQQLAAVGARVLGAVLNDPDAKAAAYGEYSYSYGYAER